MATKMRTETALVTTLIWGILAITSPTFWFLFPPDHWDRTGEQCKDGPPVRHVKCSYRALKSRRHRPRSPQARLDTRAGSIDEDWVDQLESRDNLFPEIDYRVYSPAI